MKINKKNTEIFESFFLFSYIIIVGLLSIVFIDLNIGDNEKYSHNYLNIVDFGLFDAYSNFILEIGSLEPIYFLLSYICGNYIEYFFFISLINMMFIFLIHRALKSYFQNYNVIFYILIISTPYIYILLLEVHRLKLAIIFLLLVFIIKSRYKITFLVLSIMSHLQVIIIYFPHYLFRMIKGLFKLKISIFSLILFVIFVSFIVYFYTAIESKVMYYSNGISIEFSTLFLFCFYSIFLYVIKDEELFLLYFPMAFSIFILSFIIGGDRINFILIIFILVFEIERFFNHKIYSLIIIVPMIFYNTYKTIDYLKEYIDALY